MGLPGKCWWRGSPWSPLLRLSYPITFLPDGPVLWASQGGPRSYIQCLDCETALREAVLCTHTRGGPEGCSARHAAREAPGRKHAGKPVCSQLREQKDGIEDEREDCVASLHAGHTSSSVMDSSLVCAFQGAGQNDLVREGSAHSARRVD